jgi:hypothetical protein
MLILTGFLEATLVLAAVYFEPTYSVRGHLHGEAFFDGKSTSWWRHELERWEVHTLVLPSPVLFDDDPVRRVHSYNYTRQSTWFEKYWQRWVPEREWEEAEILAFLNEGLQGPRLLRGDPAAGDVLNALLDDPSPKIRRFARIGLGMAPVPGDEP